MAELTDEQKDRISHRGRAFRGLREVEATRRPAGQRATVLKVAPQTADVACDEGEQRRVRACRSNRPWSGSSASRPAWLGIALSIVFVLVVGLVDLDSPGPRRLARTLLRDARRARDLDRRARVGAHDRRDWRRRGAARRPSLDVTSFLIHTWNAVVWFIVLAAIVWLCRRPQRDDAQPTRAASSNETERRRRPPAAERGQEHAAARGVARPQGPAGRRARRDADDQARREAAPDGEGDERSLRRDRTGAARRPPGWSRTCSISTASTAGRSSRSVSRPMSPSSRGVSPRSSPRWMDIPFVSTADHLCRRRPDDDGADHREPAEQRRAAHLAGDPDPRGRHRADGDGIVVGSRTRAPACPTISEPADLRAVPAG